MGDDVVQGGVGVGCSEPVVDLGGEGGIDKADEDLAHSVVGDSDINHRFLNKRDKIESKDDRICVLDRDSQPRALLLMTFYSALSKILLGWLHFAWMQRMLWLS